jgi:DIS3-like exonuclease 2
VDKNGKNKVWYGKSVIRSCARLDYATAQNIIDGKCGNSKGDDSKEPSLWDPARRPTAASNFDCQQVADGVRLMHKVAMSRRRLRFKHGALALNRTKVVFRMDKETNTPYQAEAYPIKDSNRLVEEYMLLANYLVRPARACPTQKRAPPH